MSYTGLSKRIKELPKSNFPAILKIAEEDKTVISLGPGEPDFNAPKAVKQALKKAVDKNLTHYSPTSGRRELLEAIAKKLRKENKIKVENPSSEIIATAGSTEAIMMGIMAIVDVGEELLIPNPGFLTYKPTVELIEGSPISYNLSDSDGFQIHAEEIAKLCTEKTQGIIINSPSNPTGTVLKRNVLEEIADLAVEKNLLVISDEAYEHLVYNPAKHLSIASLNGMQKQVLTLLSFSKSFAMPGFRLGYAVGHEELVKAMQKFHLYTSLSPNTMSQVAGVAALQKCGKDTERMQKEYAKRRKVILQGLREVEGLEVEVEPEGAFYVFPKITNGMNSSQAAEFLLKKAKVLGVPGNEFGTQGEGFLRFSYATALPKIKVAMERMQKVFR
jgi:aminotransferase